MRIPEIETRKSLRTPIRALMGFSLATNILLLAAPLHMLQVYDRVLSSRSIETLIYLTLIVAAALALYGLAEMFRGHIAQRLSNLYMLEYAEGVFDYLVHDRTRAKDPTKTLQDINTVRSFLAGRQFINLFDLPFFPMFLLLMFLLHVTLGLVTIFGIVAMIGVAVLNNKLTSASRESSSTTKNEASSFSNAVMRRTDDVRAMGMLPSIIVRWGQKTATSLNSADDAAQYTSAFFWWQPVCAPDITDIHYGLGSVPGHSGGYVRGNDFCRHHVAGQSLVAGRTTHRKLGGDDQCLESAQINSGSHQSGAGFTGSYCLAGTQRHNFSRKYCLQSGR